MQLLAIELQLLFVPSLRLTSFPSNHWRARDDGEAWYIALLITALQALFTWQRRAVVDVWSDAMFWWERLLSDGYKVQKKCGMKVLPDTVFSERRNRTAAGNFVGWHLHEV